MSTETFESALDALVAMAENATSDVERWQIIAKAWATYYRQGAGVFDWDYDSRTLMDALTADARWQDEEDGPQYMSQSPRRQALEDLAEHRNLTLGEAGDRIVRENRASIEAAIANGEATPPEAFADHEHRWVNIEDQAGMPVIMLCQTCGQRCGP